MIYWWGLIIDEYYVFLEVSGLMLIIVEDWLMYLGLVGKFIQGGVYIVGVDGSELLLNQLGEIYFEGGYFFEYFNDLVKIVVLCNKYGWVIVGDVGYFDDDGYLFLIGWCYYMIIFGGVNIYLQEVENFLVVYFKVFDVVVFGVFDDEMG